MVALYFNKGKGRTGPVEYVLDKERVASGEATLLRGDAQITADLIKTNNNELKYRSGVLSFTEKDLDPKIKAQIMDDFEKSTFAGMDKSQYNILWVQHKDKDRLELHFVIPRLELNTGLAFNPHWHKADQDRLLLFQDIQNSKYNLTNPYDQERANTLQIPTNWDNRATVKEEINEVIIQGVSTGLLQNRDQIVEFLESNGLEVKRSNKGKLSKNFIAVKKQGTKDYIRLKGAYYNESFTSAATVEKQLTAREREHSFTTPEQLREAEQRLDKAIQTRAKYNNERYQRAEPEQDINQVVSIDNDINSNNRDNQRGIHISTEVSLKTNSRAERVASTKEPEVRRQRQQIHQEQGNIPKRRQDNNIHQNRGLNEDRTGTNIRTTTSEDTDRIRRQRKQEQRALEEAREARVRLYKSIREQSKKLRAEYEKNSIELPREYERTISRARENTKQSSNHIRAIESIRKPITRVVDSIREFGSKCNNYIKDAREYLKNKYNEYIKGYNELPYKLQETADIIQSTTKEMKSELSFNDVEKFRVSLNNSVDFSNEKVQQQQQSQSRGYSMSM